MPRIEIRKRTLYKFHELSDKAKANAIENNYYWNVEHCDWWDYQYEDAKTVHLKISGFDTDRGSFCDLDFIQSPEDTANAIIKEHGESCDTYKIAKTFLKARQIEIEGCADDGIPEDDIGDELEDVYKEFKKQLSEEYLSLLRQELEYLTGADAISDSLICNDKEFLEDGTNI